MTPQPAPSLHNLLICSVGGTPEPIVQSLLHWRPAAVRFVVSPQTRSQVDAALRSYAEHTGQPLSPGCYEYVTVEDVENLGQLVAVLRPLAVEVQRWTSRGGDYQVLVDFTGGTKCMSAALALVARRWPCEFSYVGGARRSKQGVGVVESGSERVVHSANPWDALGYQVVEEAVTVFNHGGYAAAAALLDQAVKSCTAAAVKRELSTLKAVVDACAAWDRFDHHTAVNRFDDALKNRNDLVAILADAQGLIRYIEAVQPRIVELAGQTEPTIDWVFDLLANARRRREEGRLDDAVARLYRAIESLAQIALAERHLIVNTKQVALDQLPESLRGAWAARAQQGQVFLGLQDAYTVLEAAGDPLGHEFVELQLHDRERSPLVARNQSILAHGFATVGPGVFDQLWTAALRLAGIDAAELLAFPRLVA